MRLRAEQVLSYRNYFAEANGQVGQSARNQIDCLSDLGHALGNTSGKLWTMLNGYALASAEGLTEISQIKLRALDRPNVIDCASPFELVSIGTRRLQLGMFLIRFRRRIVLPCRLCIRHTRIVFGRVFPNSYWKRPTKRRFVHLSSTRRVLATTGSS